MSYWVRLCDVEDRVVEVTSHQDGGNYVIGGTTSAELNVTYNYAKVWRDYEWSLRDLDGRRAGDCLPELRLLVKNLGTEPDDDYWKATPGNAGRALARLLEWGELYPDAVFNVN